MLLLLTILLTFGRFTAAADLDTDIQGNIYVVDRAANTLVQLSPTGDSLRAVAGFGNGTLQFDEPVAVCANRGNDVYVADRNNHRIQRFNRTLDLVATIATRDDPDERRRFGYPRDIAVTRQGDLVIVDGENRRIVKIDAVGRTVFSFGDITAGQGRLADPSHVATDDADNVYVLDGIRVVQFDPFGNFVRELPGPHHAAYGNISITHDTLTVLDSAEVSLFDLATNTPIVTLTIEARPVALLYAGERFIGVEPKRGVVLGGG